MEPRPDRPDPPKSEDEIARELIERIAREVDLESGRKPLAGEPEPESEPQPAAELPVDEPASAASEPAAAEPEERSEEDVVRELIERIAREVDEEERG